MRNLIARMVPGSLPTSIVLTFTLACGTAHGWPPQSRPQEAPASWPRQFKSESGATLTVYQPQVERWDDFKRLHAVFAIMGKAADSNEEIYGGLKVVIDTATDHDARTVDLHNIQLEHIALPALQGEEARKAEKFVREVFPRGPVTITLDRILANLERSQVSVREAEVSNEPPQMFMSWKPAVLVIIDGDPIYERVGDTHLGRVINTPSLLLKDARVDRFFLAVGNSWIWAPKLSGPWDAANTLSDAFDEIPGDPKYQGIRTRLPGKIMSIDQVPQVFVTGPPAELLVTDGEPRLMPIPGTNLQFVFNTQADVFVNPADGFYYLLISGRWFRTEGKDFPLAHVSGDELPDDFRRIPPDHPCGRVLASVPGTPQALESIYAAMIPRTAKVKRKGSKAEVSYQGAPQFETIEGTSLEYGVNTSQDVVRLVDRHYLCYNGVWFDSDGPEGPWAVSDTIPDEIYQIPPESPLYHLTYVQVYGATPETVTTGYLPGYLGTYVSDDHLVFGTGYTYPRPKAYYANLQKDWQHHKIAHMSFRQSYGHGYHYDHVTGTFRRSREARAHHATLQLVGNPYHGGGGAVTPARFNQPGAAGNAVRQAPPGTMYTNVPVTGSVPDLYYGADGNVYRRGGTTWQRYDAGGWNDAGRAGHIEPARYPSSEPDTWTRPTPTQRGLNSSAQSRANGDLRSAQYVNYRASRGNRTW